MQHAPRKIEASDEVKGNNDDLIKRINQDDVIAFEQLFATYYKELVLYVRTHISSTDIAEGIVQDIFVRIWEKRADWNPQRALRSSLYAQARTESLAYLRKQRRRRGLLSTWNRSSSDTMPADRPYQEEELTHWVNRAVEALPTKRKEIYCLSRHYGLSYKEIAALLGISVKTVEAQMGKALKSLREQLKSLR